MLIKFYFNNMYLILLMFMFIVMFMICLLMMLLNLLISKKEILDREKISSFECGFDSLSLLRLPFSIHFYLIGILFLVFDVEVVYLFPMVNLFTYLSIWDWLFISFLILMILYLGLEFEKLEGSLKWIF
uniref:NADH-ubiquinone oxidoreductase chain 3 n=1 Tax=Psyttalia lounsburyi TaxID=405760 RepID=A0A8A4J8P7_9HYME|nr:NADH dehydrogenase subunit 3 [Psyttalia lounsburyi]